MDFSTNNQKWLGPLKILSVNIQSLISKKASLGKLLTTYHDPQAICECESWLNCNILNNEILPLSYKLYRNDCEIQFIA